MATQETLNNFLTSVASDVNGFLGASVVDLGTGMSLASTSRASDFDLDVAAAYNSEMVKAKFKTMQALGLEGGLVDMLLTLREQLHLIRMLNDQMFVYVAVSSDQTNLALLRSSVNSNISKFDLE